MESCSNTISVDFLGNKMDCRSIPLDINGDKLQKISRFMDGLKNEQSQLKNDMLSALENCIVYAVRSANKNTAEPFKPLVRTKNYAGECRRN